MSRIDRVSSLLKQEIAGVIQKDISTSKLGIVSITDVDVSKDLRSAHVYFSCIGAQITATKAEGVLQKAAGYIQNEISKTVKMKNLPRLVFRYDKSLKRGSALLDKMNQL